MYRHQIKSQVLDIKLSSGEGCFLLQKQLSDIYHGQLTSEIDKVFDQCDEPGNIIAIDKLEVDLGLVTFERLAEGMQEQLPLKLQQALTRLLDTENCSGVYRHSQQQRHLQLIEYYCQYACLPWWGQGQNLTRLVEQQFEQLESSFITLLSQLLQQVDVVAKRLLQQLSGSQCIQLMAALQGCSLSVAEKTYAVLQDKIAVLDLSGVYSADNYRDHWLQFLARQYQQETHSLPLHKSFSRSEPAINLVQAFVRERQVITDRRQQSSVQPLGASLTQRQKTQLQQALTAVSLEQAQTAKHLFLPIVEAQYSVGLADVKPLADLLAVLGLNNWLHELCDHALADVLLLVTHFYHTQLNIAPAMGERDKFKSRLPGRELETALPGDKQQAQPDVSNNQLAPVSIARLTPEQATEFKRALVTLHKQQASQTRTLLASVTAQHPLHELSDFQPLANLLTALKLEPWLQRLDDKALVELLMMAAQFYIEELKIASGAKTHALLEQHHQPEALYPEDIYIHNSGLVLLWPFFLPLFERLGLVSERQLHKPELAVLLLHYLTCDQAPGSEHQLVLNKVLCQVPLEQSIDLNFELTAGQQQLLHELLSSVLEHWQSLNKVSVAWLRQVFLHRTGVLKRQEQQWLLQIEGAGADVLLKTLPWSTSHIKLPWSERILVVEWRY